MARPVVLIVRDGWGVGRAYPGNAVLAARTPVTDALLARYPHSVLAASGEAVGLRPGVMGSSEVGHLNMGAGRVADQEIVRVDKAIASGHLFTQPEFVRLVKNCRYSGTQFHLMGLIQDQGVHADEQHLFAILKYLAELGIRGVRIHFFADGRDTPPRSALTYLERLEAKIVEYGTGRVASVMGRYYAMDRAGNWDRTQRAYRALVHGEGFRAYSAREAIKDAYSRADRQLRGVLDGPASPGSEDVGVHLPPESDEFIRPTMVVEGADTMPATIRNGDSVLHFNYRQDRAIQLTKALIEPDPFPFSRGAPPSVCYAGLTRYYDEFAHAVLPPLELRNILGEVLSANGLWQLRLSEYQKYRHVTSFFNGKRLRPYVREDRVQVPSITIPEDLKPEMSAYETTELAICAVEEGISALRTHVARVPGLTSHFGSDLSEARTSCPDRYNFILMNLANCDMVGHTGVFDAAVRAVEVVDECVGRVVEAVLRRGGIALVTSDHGNVDEMLSPVDGSPQTAHSTADVDFILVARDVSGVRLRDRGILSEIAPTVLDLLGIQIPPEMTALSLLKTSIRR